MTAEENVYKAIGVPEMFMQAVNAAVDLKRKVVQTADTTDVGYREAFYEFYHHFMSLYYVTRFDVLNGRTLDGLESAEKRQRLIDAIEEFDEFVMTGRLDRADATTGVKLFRQYIDYLRFYGLVQVPGN